MKDHQLSIHGSASMYVWVDSDGNILEEQIEDFGWNRDGFECSCGESFDDGKSAHSHMVEVGEYEDTDHQ